VRDSLKTKLKDTEASVVTKDRELKQAASQTVSDHEVIDFLDNRTQELERDLNQAKDEAAKAKEQGKLGAVGLTAEVEEMKQAQKQAEEEARAVAAALEKANGERDQALAQVAEMTALVKQAEEKKAEAEAQFKAQKKLLVKEVKALRAAQKPA
jgi:colicin import membrane protein